MISHLTKAPEFHIREIFAEWVFGFWESLILRRTETPPQFLRARNAQSFPLSDVSDNLNLTKNQDDKRKFSGESPRMVAAVP